MEEDFLKEKGFSPEEQKEILEQIDETVSKSKMPVTPDLFKLSPKKRGVFFPAVINILAVISIGAAIYFANDYFNKRQETLSSETQKYLSAEGKLIDELKRESEEALSEKDNQISSIKDQMSRIDNERQALQDNMDSEIQIREDELRLEMEEALRIERERLQDAGTSAADIERQLALFEDEKTADFNAEINAFKIQSENALKQKDEELERERAIADELLQQSIDAKTQIEAEYKQKTAEQNTRFEEEKQRLEAASTEAQAALLDMSKIKEQEKLVTDQIVGAYKNIMDNISRSEFDSALSGINALTTLLNDKSLENIPSIAGRKEVELLVLNQLKNDLVIKAAKEEIDTSSLVKTADLLITARNTADLGNAAYLRGDIPEAKRLLNDALGGIPALSAAVDTLAEIEKKEVREALNTEILSGESLYTSGKTDDAIISYRLAALRASGENDDLVKKAMDGIESVLSLEHQKKIKAKDNTILEINSSAKASMETLRSESNDKITALSTEITESESEIAALETDIEKASADITELETRNTNAGETIAEFEDKSRESAAEIEDLKSRIETAMQEIERLYNENTAAAMDINNIETELAESRIEIDQYILEIEKQYEDLSASAAEIGSLREESGSKTLIIDDLNAEAAQSKEKISELDTDLAEALESIETYKRNAGTGAERLSEIERKLEGSREENLRLQEELDDAVEELVNFITSVAPDERIKELIDIYSRYDERLNSLLSTDKREDSDQAELLFSNLLREPRIVDIFPGILSIYSDIQKNTRITDTLEIETVARASAFKEILGFLDVLSDDPLNTESTKKISERAVSEPLFRDVINKVQEIVSEKVIEESEYSTSKLIGPVSALTGTGMVIELLVSRELKIGDSVVLKRKNRFGEESIIASARVSFVTSSKAGAEIEEVIKEGSSAAINDMVYLMESR